MDKINGYTERCCVRGKDNTINAGEAAHQNEGAGQLYNLYELIRHKRHTTTNKIPPKHSKYKVEYRKAKDELLSVED